LTRATPASTPAQSTPAVGPAPKDVAAPAASEPETIEDTEVPIPCNSCGTVYAVAYRYLKPGTVLRCPVCQTSFSPTQRLFLAVGDRLQAFGDATNAEIDRHEDLLATEQRRFQTNTQRLRDEVENDLFALTAELTQPRKRSLLG